MRKLLLSLLMFFGLAGVANAQPFCPGVAPWVFADVQASDSFCTYVTWMAQNNVTLGCSIIDANNRLYCPDDFVTRKQMAAFQNRTADAIMPRICAAGQVMKWNGTAWACANDDTGGGGGGGTVTSVGTGTGLTGGPITTSGTINLLPGYQLPQSCSNGQVPKSNGTGGWTCQPDANSGGTVTSVATGAGLTGGPITAAGTVGLATTQLLPTTACATGQVAKWNGTSWACAADDTTPGGSAFVQNGNAFGAVAILGTTDNFAFDIRVNNARVMRYEPNAISPNVIGGHPINFAAGGVRGATISGGGVPTGEEPEFNSEGPNRVTRIFGTVGGGYNNQAGSSNPSLPVSAGAMATVGGGFGNRAEALASTIAGGDNSVALGNWAAIGGGINNLANGFNAPTVAGGEANHAMGTYSTVPGGRENRASGAYSFAAGRRAKTETAGAVVHDGAFVWADSNDFDFRSSANNEFAVRATGGVRFVLGIDALGAADAECTIAPDGIGGFVCPSDRNLKQNFRKLDGLEVLARVVSMPVYAFNPKGQRSHVLHYGPTAQDFHAAFGLGDSPLRIAQQDADGVALAAIQGVNEKLDQREAALRREIDAKTAEVAELKRQIAELRTTQQAEVAELRRAVEILMARTAAEGQLAARR